jgi:uncharacterized repeat protein (TIGR03806 family)
MPLWSDGATKERWLALPDGAKIMIKPDGDFDLPPGSVTIKTFRMEGRPIETRFLVRLLDGEWAGYTYEWNEAGTDATLLDEASHLVPVGGRDWFFPARAECKQCHTEAAGISLGLEVAQLNGEYAYPSGRANQLATWNRIGVFDPPLSAPVDRLPAFPRPTDGTAPASRRARAYLHANCSHCHRPEIDSSGSVDLRYATALPATMGCDEHPRKGSQGFGPDVRILAPGKPDLSMIVLRMRLLGAGRMPEVASLQVDEDGTALVSGWIASLDGCADR